MDEVKCAESIAIGGYKQQTIASGDPVWTPICALTNSPRFRGDGDVEHIEGLAGYIRKIPDESDGARAVRGLVNPQTPRVGGIADVDHLKAGACIRHEAKVACYGNPHRISRIARVIASHLSRLARIAHIDQSKACFSICNASDIPRNRDPVSAIHSIIAPPTCLTPGNAF